MELARLAIAVTLPWAAGIACLCALAQRRGRIAAAELVGYGHLAGILVLTLLMRATSAIGVRWSLSSLSALLIAILALATGACIVSRRNSQSAVQPSSTPVSPSWTWLAILAGALLAARFGALAYEVLLRPLYPWDAWTQWATKAKVWSAVGAMAPFIDYGQWLAGQPGYTDTAPRYPATVPLLQTWMALALGRFDDVLVNIPWLVLAIALAVGIYGQLRALAVSRAWALFATYAVLSLPLLDTHVALAGYADLYVSAAFVLGLLAVLHWERHRDRMQVAYLAVAVVLLPSFKVPGIIWAAILVLGLLVAAFGHTVKRVVLLAGGVAAVAAVSVLTVFRSKLASVAGPVRVEVAQPLFDNLFLFDNWHLLWYLLPIAVMLGWRNAIATMRGGSAALIAGGMFLIGTFALTRAGSWVADYTTVNRAVLHIAPAALVFGAVLVWDWSIRRESGPASRAIAAGVAVSKPADP